MGDEDSGAASDTGDPSGEDATDTSEEDELAAEQAEMAADDEAPERLGDEQAEIADEETREEYRDSTDPIELEDTDYFFLGAFGRAVIIPGFIQGLFVDGGIDGFNPGVGLTFNWRRNNFNVIANVWWNNAQADGYFRAAGDPRTDTEFIDVNLGVVFVNAEFLWSFPVVDWFAVELGFDLGVGFIYGELVRTEAYESTPGSGNFQACSGPGDGTPGYCEPAVPTSQPCYDSNGGHYNCAEPNWFTPGGDTPFLFPWVGLPHIAVRFKPVHQFQIRIDGGYGLYNFFFGGSASYGF
ncbi:MAG: hypothetical protein H6719_30895 [Sandaracinaceae bacterium]|nr:hypothetical protein [Sandaracinaceae bacterium]